MSDSITVILTLSNVPNAARVSVHVTANESPASFREKASEATKIPLDSIRLIFRGRLVGNETDKKVIEEFKLEHDSVIHCMGKPVETLPVPAASSSATLAAGSKVTVTAPSPTAAPIATQTVTLTTALANLRALNSSSAYLTAVTTLEKILSNIANHPLEEKYRKVKRGNAAFNKRLGGIPGGEAAMLSVGFSIDTVDGEPFYVMHPSPEAWPKLVQDRADLALAAQSAANAVSAAPPPMAIPSLAGAGMPDISGFGGMPNMTPQMQQAAAQMMRDPQQIQAMLQNPMVQNLLRSDPRFANNPMLQQSIDQLVNNPQMLGQLSQMMQNADLQNMTGFPGAMGGMRTPQQAQQQNGNASNDARTDQEMTEEEMLEEAIRRSLNEN